MKYACLVYMEEDTLRSVPDSECAAFGQALDEDGQRLAEGARLRHRLSKFAVAV